MEDDFLKNRVEEQFSLWSSIRRYLHMHPELSFKEEKTSAYILGQLQDFGIEDIRSGVAGTGIIADIMSENENAPWILLRADMDALPIQEANEVPYASKNKGVMHACGHDVHSTIMLGVAKMAHENKDQLKYNIRFIFQPGEELLPGGASLMIKEGVLEDHPFEKAIALHVYPELEAGKLGFRPGLYMASCDEIYIDIHGKGGHGAMPDKLIDPVLLGAQIVTSLQQVVSRKCPPAIPSVLSIGKFIAEGATNIIPSNVHLEGTFRTYDEKWRTEAHQFIQQHVKSLADAVGAEVKVEVRKGYPFLKNDPQLTQEMKTFAQRLLGNSHVVDLDLRPTGEDFAFFSQTLPVCFFRLGTADPKKATNHSVHHPQFDIDETALNTGIFFLSSFLINPKTMN